MYTIASKPEVIDHRNPPGVGAPQVFDHRQKGMKNENKDKNSFDALRSQRDALINNELQFKKRINTLEKEQAELVKSFETVMQQNKALKAHIEHGPPADKLKKLLSEKKEQAGVIEQLQDINKRLVDQLTALDQKNEESGAHERPWHREADRANKIKEQTDVMRVRDRDFPSAHGPFVNGRLAKPKSMFLYEDPTRVKDAYDREVELLEKETQSLLVKIKQVKLEKEQIDWALITGDSKPSKNVTIGNDIGDRLNNDLYKLTARLEEIRVKHEAASVFTDLVKREKEGSQTLSTGNESVNVVRSSGANDAVKPIKSYKKRTNGNIDKDPEMPASPTRAGAQGIEAEKHKPSSDTEKGEYVSQKEIKGIETNQTSINKIDSQTASKKEFSNTKSNKSSKHSNVVEVTPENVENIGTRQKDAEVNNFATSPNNQNTHTVPLNSPTTLVKQKLLSEKKIIHAKLTEPMNFESKKEGKSLKPINKATEPINKATEPIKKSVNKLTEPSNTSTEPINKSSEKVNNSEHVKNPRQSDILYKVKMPTPEKGVKINSPPKFEKQREAIDNSSKLSTPLSSKGKQTNSKGNDYSDIKDQGNGKIIKANVTITAFKPKAENKSKGLSTAGRYDHGPEPISKTLAGLETRRTADTQKSSETRQIIPRTTEVVPKSKNSALTHVQRLSDGQHQTSVQTRRASEVEAQIISRARRLSEGQITTNPTQTTGTAQSDLVVKATKKKVNIDIGDQNEYEQAYNEVLKSLPGHPKEERQEKQKVFRRPKPVPNDTSDSQLQYRLSEVPVKSVKRNQVSPTPLEFKSNGRMMDQDELRLVMGNSGVRTHNIYKVY